MIFGISTVPSGKDTLQLTGIWFLLSHSSSVCSDKRHHETPADGAHPAQELVGDWQRIN